MESKSPEAARCPTCDRVECPWFNQEGATYPASWGWADRQNDCAAHRVDWRARALEAEAVSRVGYGALAEVGGQLRAQNDIVIPAWQDTVKELRDKLRLSDRNCGVLDKALTAARARAQAAEQALRYETDQGEQLRTWANAEIVKAQEAGEAAYQGAQANLLDALAKLAAAEQERDALRERLRKVELIEFPLGQLRHLYAQMVNGYVRDQRQAADGLLSPSIKAFERLHREWKSPPPSSAAGADDKEPSPTRIPGPGQCRDCGASHEGRKCP